ncbi:MAG: DUF2278 family protein [Rhodomicrobium sp.]
MSIRYGLLRGRPSDFLHPKPDDPAPHLEVKIETPDGPWRLAVNVRSQDTSNLLFHVDKNFTHPILGALSPLPQGLTRPPREDRTLRLDYVRGDFFDTGAMRTADGGAIGDPDALDALLSAALQSVKETEGAELFAFGNPWGPEPDKEDQYFGFLPGRGIHDIHMNQGSPPPHDRDDGVWQDGGLILRFPGGGATAFFFAFQSQTWKTDDVTGKPLGG